MNNGSTLGQKSLRELVSMLTEPRFQVRSDINPESVIGEIERRTTVRPGFVREWNQADDTPLLGKLQRTKDGCIVGLGAVVYGPSPIPGDSRVIRYVHLDGEYATDGDRFRVPLADCYSTPHAAEHALKLIWSDNDWRGFVKKMWTPHERHQATVEWKGMRLWLFHDGTWRDRYTGFAHLEDLEMVLANAKHPGDRSADRLGEWA